MARSDIPETIVSAGMRIDGELKSSGNVRIDGTVTGKITTTQDLVLGANAHIDADIVAGNALIAGTVKGNVSVKQSLSLTETGKILGNVVCSKLSIQEGGVLNGNCLMREVKNDVQKLEGSKV